jgi:hypothetical protein
MAALAEAAARTLLFFGMRQDRPRFIRYRHPTAHLTRALMTPRETYSSLRTKMCTRPAPSGCRRGERRSPGSYWSPDRTLTLGSSGMERGSPSKSRTRKSTNISSARIQGIDDTQPSYKMEPDAAFGFKEIFSSGAVTVSFYGDILRGGSNQDANALGKQIGLRCNGEPRKTLTLAILLFFFGEHKMKTLNRCDRRLFFRQARPVILRTCDRR